MSSPETYLLKGPMPEISKMKLTELREECKMWRNLWGWVPPEVKYYVSRVGQQVRLVLRNYKGNLGTLIDTHWDLKSIEIGMIDKQYDAINDKYYYEKKIIDVNLNAILLLEWIKERKAYEEFEEETRQAAEKEATPAQAPDQTEPAQQDTEQKED